MTLMHSSIYACSINAQCHILHLPLFEQTIVYTKNTLRKIYRKMNVLTWVLLPPKIMSPP